MSFEFWSVDGAAAIAVRSGDLHAEARSRRFAPKVFAGLMGRWPADSRVRIRFGPFCAALRKRECRRRLREASFSVSRSFSASRSSCSLLLIGFTGLSGTFFAAVAQVFSPACDLSPHRAFMVDCELGKRKNPSFLAALMLRFVCHTRKKLPTMAFWRALSVGFAARRTGWPPHYSPLMMVASALLRAAAMVEGAFRGAPAMSLMAPFAVAG